MGKRGALTEEIKTRSKELIGYEIDTTELRLIPYIHYVMVNEHRIDPRKINAEERKIMSRWRSAGHIDGGLSEMGITKEFWNFMNEILFLGYVDVDE